LAGPPAYRLLWNEPWPSKCAIHEGGAGDPVAWQTFSVQANGANFSLNGDAATTTCSTGASPRFLENGSAFNGGLPQSPAFDLGLHLQQLETDIAAVIPDRAFCGMSLLTRCDCGCLYTLDFG
jgi:hypothetical protein